MGRTESLFAAVLLAAVVLAVVFVAMRSGPKPVGFDDPFAEEPLRGTALVSFTGNAAKDICTCYEQAYAYARNARSVESTEYRGGFSACAERLGPDGGNAWTIGWANGAQAPGTPKTCRGYYATLRDRR
jgi:hypothetical protein